MANTMSIAIAYATPAQQWQQKFTVPMGCTIHQALNYADFFTQFTELTPETIVLGVYGMKKVLSDVLKPGDRIEVYRPLICDPKQARRDRR